MVDRVGLGRIDGVEGQEGEQDGQRQGPGVLDGDVLGAAQGSAGFSALREALGGCRGAGGRLLVRVSARSWMCLALSRTRAHGCFQGGAYLCGAVMMGNPRSQRGRTGVANAQLAPENAGFPATAGSVHVVGRRVELAIGRRGERRERLGAARHDCLLFSCDFLWFFLSRFDLS